MSDFITMVNRITTELRRSNMTDAAKTAVNDAILEAAKTRFYLNETRALSFATVAGQEYYDDMGLVEIDALWYTQSGVRYDLYVENNLDADIRADGNLTQGQLTSYARQGTSLRLYPVPSISVSVFADGYGKLTPYPLVNDADTNNWLTYGERYIRTLAKSILWKEVIRDYGEATAAEAMAEDLKGQLLDETTTRQTTSCLSPTQW